MSNSFCWRNQHLTPTNKMGPTGKHSRSSNPISIMYFNARSLLPKKTELQIISLKLKPCIIAVSETWLNSDIPDASFLPHGYVCASRNDRAQRSGGGVLLSCREDINFIPRPDLQFWEESSWIEIKLSWKRSLLIACFYRAPENSVISIERFTTALEQSFSRIDLAKFYVVILGDFNATSPQWNKTDLYNSAGRSLEPATLRQGLCQHVNFSTHIRNNGSLGSTLDLLFSSENSLVDSITALPPLGRSDHIVLNCNLLVQPAGIKLIRQPGHRIWKFDNCDINKINDELGLADWSTVYHAADVDSALDAWESTFMAIVKNRIPSKFIKNIKAKNPFVTSDIEKAIKEKRAALTRLRNHPSPENRDAFKQKRNLVTHLIRKSERAYTTSLRRQASLNSCPTSSQNFWRHMKVVQGKTKSNVVPDLVNPSDGSSAKTASEKADLLNTFFAKQTELAGSSSSTPDLSATPKNTKTFQTLSCTPSDVFEVVSSLKIGKASGLDGLPSRLLRLCAKGISTSLSALFNLSFRTSTFPSSWKTALVVPVFKKGDRNTPSNYRPIALLPIVSKVLERIVYNRLARFLTPWLSKNQSGFRKKDGTVYQLTRIVQEWSNAVDEGRYVASVFFDLSKAFDRVWHDGLLAKLDSAGVKGAAYRWFCSYLGNRSQKTVVDGNLSAPAILHAGVPQGAILSPLLFSIYMNDIPAKHSTNLFADDTSSFVVDRSESGLLIKLQERTDLLCAWFAKWLLTVNAQKSAVIVFRSRKMPPIHLSIKANSSLIPQVTCHRHLGIFLNETLTWSDHVTHAISKASAKIGFLRRLSSRLDSLVLRDLYTTCIRPSLEYGSLVWSGLSLSNSKLLEKCNRSAARLILKTRTAASRDLPSELLLARAGISTLQSRRELCQTKFCIKAFKSRLPNHLQVAVLSWIPRTATHQMALRQSPVRLPLPKKNILIRSPFYSAFRTWNSLPQDLRDSCLTSPSVLFSPFPT